MIFCRLGPNALFYRALTPRWAFDPESGVGAAVAGGRFNRRAVEARYLAETADGALLEYQGESALLPPATVATYRVTAERVVDFSGGYTAENWAPIWKEAYCEWKRLAFFDDIEPPSWVIGDLVRGADVAGILYRSARVPNLRCLVLYPEKTQLFTAPVFDPEGALPLNADSWKRGRKAKSKKRKSKRVAKPK